MEPGIANQARELILAHVVEELVAKGLTPSDVPQDYDLLLEGVIDSFGVVEVVVMLEREFGFEFDFDELDAEDITRVGPLTAYVERKVGGS